MQLHTTVYGAPAYDVLRDVIGAAKHEDPLAPVTLLVPTNLAGTASRRTLAATITAVGTGVAGLTVLTVDRLAELLAAPTLTVQGRRPTTPPVLAAAWRAALATQPGLFAEVADHPATVSALVDAYRELRNVTPGARAAIAAEHFPLPTDVLRLYEDVAARLQDDWYDVADLRTTATLVATNLTKAQKQELGHVVLFLPQDLDVGSAALVAALTSHVPLDVIAGVTGDTRADAGVRRSLVRIGLDATTDGGTPAAATRVSHASDSDDEVRSVVRDVVAALEAVPAHRIAVLYGSRQPYARLLHEQFSAAGITVNGPGVRSTAEGVIPRALLELLDLAEHGLTRGGLFRFLSGVTVRNLDGRPVPTSRWERISRAAGVVSPADWESRLQRYELTEKQKAAAQATSENPRRGIIMRCEGNAAAAAALASFATALGARLSLGLRTVGWNGLADWALSALHDLLWHSDGPRRLPDEERRAAEQVERLLQGLRGMDAVESGATLATLRQVLELQLGDDLPRVGRFGTGVLVGPLSSAVGLSLDAVFVVGLAEGLCPPRVREDALLPEVARAAAQAELPELRDRLDRQHRQLLAAFSAAPSVTACFPRGDLRRSGDRLPSRWLLPTMRTLSKDPKLSATKWSKAQGDWLVASPSYAATVTSTSVPATEQDWRLRALTAGVVDAPADPVLAAARALLQARHSAAFTRYDGNLTAHAADLPHPADGARIVSPTSLESWVSCPHAYFLYRLLHIEAVEQPEELLNISAADRGSVIHNALDRFFSELLGQGDVPGPDEAWTDVQRAQLLAIGEQVASEYEQAGATGHPTLWGRERQLILDDLRQFLDLDAAARREGLRTQIASELRFGDEPVIVPLPDGRSIHFAGSADRVDQTADGSLIVIDYKSGSASQFTGISEREPDKNGSKLQLPVYARAARQRLGDSTTPVRAAYWFIGPKDRGKVVELPLTDAVEARFAAVLTVIADGIAGGLYPANAPEDMPWLDWIPCPYCDPDGLGAKDRRVQWGHKKQDPLLASYLGLIEPEPMDADA